MNAITEYTPEEMMTIAAARKFRDGATCFVGVGLPSVAACLARELHAPNTTLIYESGAIGSRPTVPPLSIADLELAETADFIVAIPEIFGYWLQGGRIEMGFLGAAQIDRFANLNSTVIGGDYKSPKVRLPGAGGAPQIAAHAREIVVIVRQTARAFVSRVDFLTTAANSRTTVVTDLGILETHQPTGELILTAKHPGVSVDQIRKATGWALEIASDFRETPAPTEEELHALREKTV
jgi:glutaconate CoA-transferase subunit B